MKLKEPRNVNYCAIVAKIDSTVALPKMDRVKHGIILGNKIIISKEYEAGKVGLYFPVECALSPAFLKANNLYRKADLNEDTTKSGYFEENGRIRCIKFQKVHESQGLFMPLDSLKPFLTEKEISSLSVGDAFDMLGDVEICRKYTVKKRNASSQLSGSKKTKKTTEEKLVEGQFRFHQDTSMMYRNLHRIEPDTLIGISSKWHGTSSIVGKLLCKKPLTLVEKIAKKLGISVVDTQYDYIFASRKVIKNNELNPNANHYYKENIWGIAAETLKPYLKDGMTFYFEIVGYTPDGAMIQKGYDYGCKENEFKTAIYRITQTNDRGEVFEFSAKQVQDFCKEMGISAVKELYYGYAKHYFPYGGEDLTEWQKGFLEKLKSDYNEKDCGICLNKVPEEGCVIRVEGSSFEAYKCKSARFYEWETSMLDSGEVDIESDESEN